MEESLQKLLDLGIEDIKHLHGSLLSHLQGTRDLLRKWGASEALQNAGLFHAIYSTDSYSERIASLDKRKQIAEIIGNEAENIVYEYCACDRKYFWPKIGFDEKPLFKNRFTNETYYISRALLMNLCELTVANEIEIAHKDKEFKHQHGAYFNNFFTNMEPYLSDRANAMVRETFGHYT